MILSCFTGLQVCHHISMFTQLRLQGRKVKRHRRLFKKQESAAPVGRDSMAKEFGIVDELEDLEGAMQHFEPSKL
jgi:hypothetical protein